MRAHLFEHEEEFLGARGYARRDRRRRQQESGGGRRLRLLPLLLLSLALEPLLLLLRAPHRLFGESRFSLLVREPLGIFALRPLLQLRRLLLLCASRGLRRLLLSRARLLGLGARKRRRSLLGDLHDALSLRGR